MRILNQLVDSEDFFLQIRRHKNVFCYGAGAKGMQTVKLLRKYYDIVPTAFIDGNEEKWGKTCAEIPVVSYGEVKEKYDEYCILVTCVYHNAKEIVGMLHAAGERNPVFQVCNPYKAEIKLLTVEEIKKDEEQLEITYEALEDDKSREIFTAFLYWKMTGDMMRLAQHMEGDWMEVFGCDLLPACEDYVYVDVGAYTGDTIVRFLSFCKGRYERIIAYEPDEANYSECLNLIRNGRLEKIETVKMGLWSRKEEKKFFTVGRNSVYESSNMFGGVQDIISTERVKEIDGDSSVEIMMVDTLDNQLKGIGGKMIWKIDALASEVPILYGAEKSIRTLKPIIIMEYGTHSEYMAETIPYLKKLNPEYKFYLRQRYTFNNNRMILYVM